MLTQKEGFSTNKRLFEKNGINIDKALHFIKDYLIQVGGLVHVKINSEC